MRCVVGSPFGPSGAIEFVIAIVRCVGAGGALGPCLCTDFVVRVPSFVAPDFEQSERTSEESGTIVEREKKNLMVMRLAKGKHPTI